MPAGLPSGSDERSSLAAWPPAIRAAGVDVAFQGPAGIHKVLAGLDIEVADGELLTIIGPSGCGKSTLLRVIADLLDPAAGAIEVFGQPPAVARRRRDVGFVFQDSTLLPWRTVIENLRLPDEVGRGARVERRDEQGGASAAELITMMGLAGRENAYPHQLSGGQRQRVGVARALAADPEILLMDEPFGALDPITRDELQREFLLLQQRLSKTVVFVTHDLREALRLGSRIALMEAGRLVTVLAPAEFLRSADPLASAYVRAFGEGLESAANRGTT